MGMLKLVICSEYIEFHIRFGSAPVIPLIFVPLYINNGTEPKEIMFYFVKFIHSTK